MWEYLHQEQSQKQNDQQGQTLHTYHVGAGQLCPHCKQGKLDYNSLLNLACPQCGYELNASFT